MNLWAAALHYAYDGMIWKLRNTGTAKVLDVTGATTSKASAARSSNESVLVAAGK
jgi:hypothetical protein